MGTDALGYLLGLLVLGGSFIAVRYRNMLLTLGAAALWATLLAYILANTTAGTNWQSMFILSVASFLCAFALLSFFGRRRGEGSSFVENFTKLQDSVDNRESKAPTRGRGLMDLSNEEYRAMIRTRMHKREEK